MAYKGKEIFNPKTKQGIRFLQTAKDTDGHLLEMESTYQGQSKEPAAHYHPYQEEDFKVMEGQITVKIHGQIMLLHKGDTLHIPRNTIHSMWNRSDKRTVVRWQVRPALDTENLLETAAGLATEGRTNEHGMPNILQVALMANKYDRVFRLSKPSFFIQRLIFLPLIPLAWMAGLRPTYEHYLD
jgi:quercetin dioxygenase-like cupin family protein